jgi:hypothetical protein
VDSRAEATDRANGIVISIDVEYPLSRLLRLEVNVELAIAVATN